MDLDLAWVQEGGTPASGWRWGLALQAPLGRREDWSGSGSWDGLAGLAGWKRFGSLRIHGQAERVWMGLTRNNPWSAVVVAHSFTRAWAGAGIQGRGSGFWGGLGLDITLAYSSTPYGSGIRRMDSHGLEQHWTLTHTRYPRWRFVVSEDADTFTAPDIKAALVYTF
jgi:hypothetical protein